MGFSDDDKDFVPSSSNEDYFTSADHGKRKEFLQSIKKEMGSVGEAKAKETELRSQVSLSALKPQLVTEGAKDEEKKRTEEEQKKEKSKAPKTKTQKEKEEAMVEGAQDNPDVDTMLERENTKPEVSDEETQSEPG